MKVKRFFESVLQFILDVFLFNSWPKRFNDKIVIDNEIVIHIDCFHSKSVNVKNEIREIVDHNIRPMYLKIMSDDQLKNTLYAYMNLFTVGEPFIIRKIKLQDFSEYKRENRKKTLKQIFH